MWMTDMVREAKRQLRDVFGIEPSRTIDDEPCFDRVKDGIYPMRMAGKVEHVAVIDGRFYFLELVEPKGKRGKK